MFLNVFQWFVVYNQNGNIFSCGRATQHRVSSVYRQISVSDVFVQTLSWGGFKVHWGGGLKWRKTKTENPEFSGSLRNFFSSFSMFLHFNALPYGRFGWGNRGLFRFVLFNVSLIRFSRVFVVSFCDIVSVELPMLDERFVKLKKISSLRCFIYKKSLFRLQPKIDIE